MPLSLPPAMRITCSGKEFRPAMVRLCGKTAGVIREAVEQAENYHGLEILDAMESLYHRTPFRVRISSIRCSTPPKVLAISRMVS